MLAGGKTLAGTSDDFSIAAPKASDGARQQGGDECEMSATHTYDSP
jgi:hypothetical protein